MNIPVGYSRNREPLLEQLQKKLTESGSNKIFQTLKKRMSAKTYQAGMTQSIDDVTIEG